MSELLCLVCFLISTDTFQTLRLFFLFKFWSIIKFYLVLSHTSIIKFWCQSLRIKEQLPLKLMKKGLFLMTASWSIHSRNWNNTSNITPETYTGDHRLKIYYRRIPLGLDSYRFCVHVPKRTVLYVYWSCELCLHVLWRTWI